MTLPLPKLDDQTFAQLMEDARKLIPRYAPEWTDFNTHDPGITFVELFAWLTELQRYYLNQVRDENFLKFLKLLGIRLKDATSATADVTFFTYLFVPKQTYKHHYGEGLNPPPIDSYQIVDFNGELKLLDAEFSRVSIGTHCASRPHVPASLRHLVDEQANLPVLVPQGTKLTTKEQVIFETDSSLLIISAILEKIISSCEAGRKDNTGVNRQEGLSFFAFGETAEAGSYLYLGFNLLYIFDWDEVPCAKSHNKRLTQFLSRYFGLSWVENTDSLTISKRDDETAIAITDGKRHLVLELDEFRNRVTLTLDGNIIHNINLVVKGESSKLIYGQPFPAHQLISLTFNLFKDYPIARGSHSDEPIEFIPSASLVWEYYGCDRQWKALQVEHDETQMLSQSGRVWFTAPSDMYVRKIYPFSEQLYWLRIGVKKPGYELPPQIDTILLNTISVTQRDTLSEVRIYSSNYQRIQSFPASYLVLKSNYNIVQVRQFDSLLEVLIFRSHSYSHSLTLWLFVILCLTQELKAPDGLWKDLEGEDYILEKNESAGLITLIFTKKIPQKGKDNIRLISYSSKFDNQRFLGKSNGLPAQTFFLKQFPVLTENFKIQVQEKIEKYYCWRDWIRVDDFDASNPEDRHYVLDFEKGEIYFGDGVNGRIPQVSENKYDPNIRIVSCQTVSAEKGNVDAKAICDIFNPIYSLWQRQFLLQQLKIEMLENRRPTSSGASRETLEKGKLRARKELKQSYRAVSSYDFELLARSTPGLRVARSKAVSPLQTEAKHLVKIVVVPYSETPKPAQPSQGFLHAVSQHLERHRLITTQVQVIAPSYVEVSVKAIVLIRSRTDPDRVRNTIEKFLNERFLHPLKGGSQGKGWEFGRTVYKSEVYKAIEDSDEGVDCVEKLELVIQNADREAKPFFDKDGNICISPQSLIFSIKHQIEILNPKP